MAQNLTELDQVIGMHEGLDDRLIALDGMTASQVRPYPLPTSFHTSPRLAESWRHFAAASLGTAVSDPDLMALVGSKRFWALVYLSQLIPYQRSLRI